MASVTLSFSLPFQQYAVPIFQLSCSLELKLIPLMRRSAIVFSSRVAIGPLHLLNVRNVCSRSRRVYCFCPYCYCECQRDRPGRHRPRRRGEMTAAKRRQQRGISCRCRVWRSVEDGVDNDTEYTAVEVDDGRDR